MSKKLVRPRPVRPVERQNMHEWLTDKLNSREIHGLEWTDQENGVFKIRWCHGSQHGWSRKETFLFEEWAKHTGRYDPNNEDPKRWKANFRCALNSLKSIVEVKEESLSKGKNAFRVYRMVPKSETKQQKTRMRAKNDTNPNYCCVSSRGANLRLYSDIQYHEVSNTSSTYSNCDSTIEEAVISMENDSLKDEVDEEECENVEEADFDEEVDIHNLPNQKFLHRCSSEVKSLPDFEELMPGLTELEFGKTYCIRKHNSGFVVECGSTAHPLTPTIGPLPWPSSILCKTNPLLITTSVTSWQDNYPPMSYPDTPEGSVSSSDNMADGRDSQQTSMYTIADVSDEVIVISTPGLSDGEQSQGLTMNLSPLNSHTRANKRWQISPSNPTTNTVVDVYCPLTPP